MDPLYYVLAQRVWNPAQRYIQRIVRVVECDTSTVDAINDRAYREAYEAGLQDLTVMIFQREPPEVRDLLLPFQREFFAAMAGKTPMMPAPIVPFNENEETGMDEAPDESDGEVWT